MTSIQSNPFHRANPYKVIQYQRFEHPHFHAAKKTDNRTHHYKQVNIYQPNRIIQNNWTFHDDNLTKKIDFSRRSDLSTSQVSDFEIRMKMSNIGIGSVVNKNNQKVVFMNESRIENPFYRKNLLLKKQDVMNQVQLDLSGYRTKARSTYEQNYMPSPIENGRKSIERNVSFADINSPNTIENQSGNGSLIYSPTPRDEKTKKLSAPISPSTENPQIIKFNGKLFYLNIIQGSK